MKNGMTELVFILDRSGSMSGLESDTIGGFNSMLQKQKQAEGACFVTTVLFDSGSCTLHDRLPLAEIPPMTAGDYCVGGCTALLDAVGGTIRHISDIHRYIRSEDVPENTLVVITTDGMENASRSFGAAEVKRMIEEKKRECGWEFLFLGANIDAAETAGSLGIAPERAVNYCCDSIGTAVNFEALSDAVTEVRRCRPMGAKWKARIEEDFGRRCGRAR